MSIIKNKWVTQRLWPGGRWSCFRHIVYEHKEITQHEFEKILSNTFHRKGRTAHVTSHPVTFDFVNCARAPLDSEPISEAHFQSILSCCNLDLHAVNDKIQLFSGLSQQLGEARHTNSKLSHINRRSNSVSQGGAAISPSSFK